MNAIRLRVGRLLYAGSAASGFAGDAHRGDAAGTVPRPKVSIAHATSQLEALVRDLPYLKPEAERLLRGLHGLPTDEAWADASDRLAALFRKHERELHYDVTSHVEQSRPSAQEPGRWTQHAAARLTQPMHTRPRLPDSFNPSACNAEQRIADPTTVERIHADLEILQARINSPYITPADTDNAFVEVLDRLKYLDARERDVAKAILYGMLREQGTVEKVVACARSIDRTDIRGFHELLKLTSVNLCVESHEPLAPYLPDDWEKVEGFLYRVDNANRSDNPQKCEHAFIEFLRNIPRYHTVACYAHVLDAAKDLPEYLRRTKILGHVMNTLPPGYEFEAVSYQEGRTIKNAFSVPVESGPQARPVENATVVRVRHTDTWEDASKDTMREIAYAIGVRPDSTGKFDGIVNVNGHPVGVDFLPTVDRRVGITPYAIRFHLRDPAFEGDLEFILRALVKRRDLSYDVSDEDSAISKLGCPRQIPEASRLSLIGRHPPRSPLDGSVGEAWRYTNYWNEVIDIGKFKTPNNCETMPHPCDMHTAYAEANAAFLEAHESYIREPQKICDLVGVSQSLIDNIAASVTRKAVALARRDRGSDAPFELAERYRIALNMALPAVFARAVNEREFKGSIPHFFDDLSEHIPSNIFTDAMLNPYLAARSKEWLVQGDVTHRTDIP